MICNSEYTWHQPQYEEYMNLLATFLMPYLFSPIKNFIYNTIYSWLKYIAVNMFWESLFYPSMYYIFKACAYIGDGFVWSVENFFNIAFIKNFILDIFNTCSDLAGILEKSYSLIARNLKSIFTAMPEEVTVKTGFEGVKNYGVYLASNCITIAGFGLLSYRFYNNYFEIFKVHDSLNEKRREANLPEISTHVPLNLIVTGSVAALQVGAMAATILSVVLPNGPVSKTAALCVSGLAEAAAQLFKYNTNKAVSELEDTTRTFNLFRAKQSEDSAEIEELKGKVFSLKSSISNLEKVTQEANKANTYLSTLRSIHSHTITEVSLDKMEKGALAAIIKQIGGDTSKAINCA